jgi:ribonuclease P protein component
MLTLKTTTDFQRVRREGRSWSHPLVVLTACPNDRNETRLGITASKSVGGAVDRNRAKRRLREAMRRKEKESGIALGQDIVLIARAPLVKAQWREVVGALNSLMQKWQIADGK